MRLSVRRGVCSRCVVAARADFRLELTVAQKCMLAGLLKIAASYLLVLHNLEPIEQSSQVSRFEEAIDV